MKFFYVSASNTNNLKESFFQSQLIMWYERHKRDLPWRKIDDPYTIWLSEIILQQTRVDQGLPYFNKFKRNYPSVQDLAEAQEDDVLKDWEGLGYYSRARNLHATAKYIRDQENGEFPKSYKELLKLKGVGDYTASAISSFAYNEVQAVVDGNVYRVLSRVFGIETPINTTKGIKEFKTKAQELISQTEPGNYNQAIMEFGALQCVPKNPDCEVCPFINNCKAYRLDQVTHLPVKEKKVYNKIRHFNYFLLKSDNKVLINQRSGKDVWHKLYEFKLIEQSSFVNEQDVANVLARELDYFGDNIVKRVESLKAHKLSHQTILIKIFEVEISDEVKEDSGLKWLSLPDLETLAFPKPLRAYLDRFHLPLSLPQ